MRTFLWLFLVLAGWLGAVEPDSLISAQPSANRGRVGIYRAETGLGGYEYYVNANAYVPERPAGIHLFFHGQGGQKGAQHFHATERYFLRPHNLIGINMCYADGDNMRDTIGKVRAAKIAVAQVIADYRIVVGRGVVASFSGGGLPHGQWWASDGAKAGTADFPFTHHALYSSNFFGAVSSTSRTSWFISVGIEEWTLADLGGTQSRVATQVYQCARRNGTLDHDFRISGKGHTIPEEEIARSAAGFARSDLALGPLLAASEAPTPATRKYLDGANAQAIGPTLAALAAALGKKGLDPANAAALNAIQARLQARVVAMTDLMERLAVEDPALAAYYGQKFIASLGKHEAAKVIGQRLVELGKTAEANACMQAQATFIELFPKLFSGSPTLDVEHKKQLAQLAAIGPQESLVARMSREFDLLPARKK